MVCPAPLIRHRSPCFRNSGYTDHDGSHGGIGHRHSLSTGTGRNITRGTNRKHRRTPASPPPGETAFKRRGMALLFSSHAEKLYDLAGILGIGVTQADAAVPTQRKLFAPQLNLGFALDGDIAAVGTLVDENEFVAPPLNFSVDARG